MEAAFNNNDETARSACPRLGAVCLRGLFRDRIDVLRDGQKPGTDWFPVLWPKEKSE